MELEPDGDESVEGEYTIPVYFMSAYRHQKLF